MGGMAFEAMKALLSKSSKQYETLNQYIKNLQAYEVNVASAWTKSGNDRYYILKSINDIGKELTNIYKGYYSFTGAAKEYVNIMKKFNKIIGRINIPCVNVSYKGVEAKKTSSTVIKINTKVVKAEAKKIGKLAQNIGEMNLGYKNLAANLDNQINVYLRGKTTALRDLNKRLDNAAIKLVKVASVLVSICDNYEKTEENIRKKADELKNGRDVTYIDGTMSNKPFIGEGGASSIVNYGNSMYAVRDTYTYENASYSLANNLNIILNCKDTYDQTKNGLGSGCGAVSAAVYWSMIDKTAKNPESYCQNGKKNQRAEWNKGQPGGNVHKRSEDYNTILNSAYKRIMDGKPSIIFFGNGVSYEKDPNNSISHYVTVVGVANSADPTELSEKDILVFDPYGAKIMTLQEAIIKQNNAKKQAKKQAKKATIRQIIYGI